MARGQTWSEEEVKALIEIWSDQNICQLLVTTHKNNEVYKLISEKMKAVGFPRTVAQCRTKVKKLHERRLLVSFHGFWYSATTCEGLDKLLKRFGSFDKKQCESKPLQLKMLTMFQFWSRIEPSLLDH
uniref:Myb/SANT-like DNA-binding domain-containing protein n=1 Tax=Periophthalmus magnuspinnatus TaxID=409849 RepID=A0A3B4AEE9_9GOBI